MIKLKEIEKFNLILMELKKQLNLEIMTRK